MSRKLVTMADWIEARTFERAARPGDAVIPEIVDHFLNDLPPATHRESLIQCGEPYDHQRDPKTGRYKPTFATFHKEDGQWVYCGNCFIGEITEPRAGATA